MDLNIVTIAIYTFGPAKDVLEGISCAYKLLAEDRAELYLPRPFAMDAIEKLSYRYDTYVGLDFLIADYYIYSADEGHFIANREGIEGIQLPIDQFTFTDLPNG